MLLHKEDFTAGFDQKYETLSLFPTPSPGEGKDGSAGQRESSLVKEGGRGWVEQGAG